MLIERAEVARLARKDGLARLGDRLALAKPSIRLALMDRTADTLDSRPGGWPTLPLEIP